MLLRQQYQQYQRKNEQLFFLVVSQNISCQWSVVSGQLLVVKFDNHNLLELCGAGILPAIIIQTKYSTA
jgi:hypothetical protein